jgi:hypothetical protein
MYGTNREGRREIIELEYAGKCVRQGLRAYWAGLSLSSSLLRDIVCVNLCGVCVVLE